MVEPDIDTVLVYNEAGQKIPMKLITPLYSKTEYDQLRAELAAAKAEIERLTYDAEILEDARTELRLLREALKVPYEPHQSVFERTLEAADNLLQQVEALKAAMIGG